MNDGQESSTTRVELCRLNKTERYVAQVRERSAAIRYNRTVAWEWNEIAGICTSLQLPWGHCYMHVRDGQMPANNYHSHLTMFHSGQCWEH